MRDKFRTRPWISTSAATILIAILLMVSRAAADAPPGPFFQGFEQNTAGWFNFSGATVTRVPSGSPGTYANGAPASAGNYYARLGQDPSPDSCVFGGGTAPIYYGPYTNWGGYSAIFPPGGYSTGVDIYLDVLYAQTHLDTRFDWSSAVSSPTGGFRRDFVFNVEPIRSFVISAATMPLAAAPTRRPGACAHPYLHVGVVHIRAHVHGGRGRSIGGGVHD
jgi:hypothetical protein